MKVIINLDKQFVMILKILALFLILMVSVSSKAADQDISLTPNGCSVTVKANTNDCSSNQCGSDSTCVCALQGDFITWQMQGSEKFKLKFSGDSPLKDSCGKNFKGSSIKCKVKEHLQLGQTFDYEVVIKGCGQGTDPRIVIGK